MAVSGVRLVAPCGLCFLWYVARNKVKQGLLLPYIISLISLMSFAPVVFLGALFLSNPLQTQAFGPHSSLVFTPQHHVSHANFPTTAFKLAAMAPTDAIATMDASQSKTVDKIASSIPDLAAKPGQCWESSSGKTVKGKPARLDARDAPGPANIAWLSSLCVDSALSSLTIFNGPLTDVPHLISRCAVTGDGSSLSFFLDFRPRAYGAYDMRDADGNYPGPDVLGRKYFEYSGARKDFDTKFGHEEVQIFIGEALTSFEGAVRAPESTSELEKLTRGPLVLDVTMPLSDNNVNSIIDAREKAANYWLGWALDTSHAHKPGAPVNSQYVYDTKYRQNSYRALLDLYKDLFGDDGSNLAAAESGPLDEAYVGGGS